MNKSLLAVIITSLVGSIPAFAGIAPNGIDGYTDTPLLPGGKWHVHDPYRPQPRIVTPGTFGTADQPGKAPSDAIVLFDGTDLSQWRNGKGAPAGWKVENGVLTVVPKSGDIFTKAEFGDIQLHLEWSEPVPVVGNSQGRGNSGVFFMGRYELQVLDCFENKTYPDGQTASIYGMHPPMVNACRPPGEWQTYDIIFTTPRFAKDGTLEAPVYITVTQNGVVVQNHADFFGPSGHKTLQKYLAHPPAASLKLQEHGNPVRFRNIWVRPLSPEEK
jgi:hypothetical protein